LRRKLRDEAERASGAEWRRGSGRGVLWIGTVSGYGCGGGEPGWPRTCVDSLLRISGGRGRDPSSTEASVSKGLRSLIEVEQR